MKSKLDEEQLCGLHDNLFIGLKDTQIVAINNVVNDIKSRVLGKKTKSRVKLNYTNPQQLIDIADIDDQKDIEVIEDVVYEHSEKTDIVKNTMTNNRWTEIKNKTLKTI